MNDLAAVALYFNADLDVARAQLRTAQAAVLTAKARPNPSLSAGAGWSNSPESPLVFHFDPAFTVETAGKRGWRTLEAQKLAEAARVAVAETAWRVRSRVRAAWLDYMMALRSLELLRNERSIRAEVVAMLDKRLGAGEASRPDFNLVRTALISVEVEVKAAETQVGESGAALAAAVGLPLLPDVDTQSIPQPPASLPLADVQKAGLLHRADIRRSLLEYAAAEANLHLEIANQYPDFQYSPGYSFDEGHHKIALSPSLNVPLFNRNRGPIGESEARRGEVEARFNALQAQAIGEMEIALARYNGALAEYADAEQRLTQTQQTREAAMRRAVQAGEEDRLALAGVRMESAVAARARLDAMRRVQSALGSLEDAVQQPLMPGPPLPEPEIKR
jgi:outer membrane protein TolC